MKPVQMFEADDGSVYKTVEEAVARDLQLQFEEWYRGNPLVSETRVDFEDLWEWFSAHKTEVMQVLETID